MSYAAAAEASHVILSSTYGALTRRSRVCITRARNGAQRTAVRKFVRQFTNLHAATPRHGTFVAPASPGLAAAAAPAGTAPADRSGTAGPARSAASCAVPIRSSRPLLLRARDRRGDRVERAARCALRTASSSKPSISRSAFSMNSNGRSAPRPRRDRSMTRRAAARAGTRAAGATRAVRTIATAPLQHASACRARRRRCRGSRRTASS